MKKTSIKQIIQFLKYHNILSIGRLFNQLKTRYYCNRFHNKWEADQMGGRSGKYNHMMYKCDKCNTIHYEFELNNPKKTKIDQ